jgi:cytochrome c biogenesis protein CcmG/thiol:disulfide interchange protein DsbE
MDTPTPTTGSDDGPEPATAPPERSRLPFSTIAVATVIALVVALSFSFLALTVIGRSNDAQRVSVEDALANVDVGPAVPPGTPVATVGQPAPDVRLDYLDGGTEQVSELGGTPLLLNFWSSTCAPCVAEMPEFQALATRADGRVRVVGVDVTDTEAGAADLLRRTGVTYRNAADPNGQLFATYGGTSLPRTVLIGADGTVLATHSGALDAAGLAALLTDNGISVP